MFKHPWGRGWPLPPIVPRPPTPGMLKDGEVVPPKRGATRELI